MAATRASRLALYRIPGGGVTSKDQLMSETSKSLGFPKWFGANWDAFRDLLRDFSWARSSGYVVIFRDANVLASAAPKDFQVLVQVAAEVSQDWRQWEVPFHFVFTGPAELTNVVAGATSAPVCVQSE